MSIELTDEQKSEAKDLADRNMGHETDEIRKDIADTEAEISQLLREIEGYRLIGDKLSLFKADAKSNGVSDRREFCRKLRLILWWRENGQQ